MLYAFDVLFLKIAWLWSDSVSIEGFSNLTRCGLIILTNLLFYYKL